MEAKLNGIEVKLKLLDRVVLPTIFPETGNRKENVIRQDVINKVNLTQSDYAELGINPSNNGGLYWGEESNKKEFSYTFTTLEADEIKASLKKLDAEKKLLRDHNGLCEIFEIN